MVNSISNQDLQSIIAGAFHCRLFPMTEILRSGGTLSTTRGMPDSFRRWGSPC